MHGRLEGGPSWPGQGVVPQEVPELPPGPPPRVACFCQGLPRPAPLHPAPPHGKWALQPRGAGSPYKNSSPPGIPTAASAASPLPSEAPNRTGQTASLRECARDPVSEGPALPAPTKTGTQGRGRGRPSPAPTTLEREPSPARQPGEHNPGTLPSQSPAARGQRPPPSLSPPWTGLARGFQEG